jgi:hypothetical protein
VWIATKRISCRERNRRISRRKHSPKERTRDLETYLLFYYHHKPTAVGPPPFWGEPRRVYATCSRICPHSVLTSAVWSWIQTAIISLPCINPAMHIQCIFYELRARLPKIFLETSAIEGLILPTEYIFSRKRNTTYCNFTNSMPIYICIKNILIILRPCYTGKQNNFTRNKVGKPNSIPRAKLKC